MSGIRPRLSHVGPNTYTVSAAVKGGQICEAFTDGKARPGSAGSTKVLGVAEIDAKPWVDPNSTDSDGFTVTLTNPLPTETVCGFGRYVVTFAADCAFGAALKAAAAGTVTPWVSGTDAANLIIGYCDEPAGVVVASSNQGLANISR